MMQIQLLNGTIYQIIFYGEDDKTYGDLLKYKKCCTTR